MGTNIISGDGLRPRFLRCLLLLPGLALGCAHRPAADLRSVPGCYRADRLLGDSLATTPAARDSLWAYFQLEVDGAVTRPMLGSRGEAWTRGEWTVRGDTLGIGLLTPQHGWSLFLIGPPTRGTYRGKAEYHTDIVRSSMEVSSYIPIRVRAVPCPIAPPT